MEDVCLGVNHRQFVMGLDCLKYSAGGLILRIIYQRSDL